MTLFQGVERCGWAKNELAIRYHDTEWGVPVREDRVHFEFLVLEAAQAGLSWDTVLKKREAYREAFCQFDPVAVAAFDEEKIEALMQNAGIIRNRLKITAAVNNARVFLETQDEFGTFDAYLWRFVGGRPICNGWERLSELPAVTKEAEALSKDLKRRGYKFVGPTICYAHMQAVGLVNDHLVSCFRYKELVTSSLH